MSENTELRRIFAPKREQEIGDWKMCHNQELHKVYVLELPHQEGYAWGI
jgi:hypothetical protein